VNDGVAYMRRSVDAAFDLVARNPRAWSRFDLTVEGFFRSFAAILIVLPMNIVTDLIANQLAVARALEKGNALTAQSYGLGDAVFSSVALCTQWLIFPVAMIFVLRFLGLAHRFTALIIAHNWGTVVVWLFNMPAFLLYAAGIIGADTALDVNFIVLGLTIYYRFYIAQVALDAGWGTAASVALLDLVLQVYFLIGLSNFAGLWLPAGS
jgi:hypothetical protein